MKVLVCHFCGKASRYLDVIGMMRNEFTREARLDLAVPGVALNRATAQQLGNWSLQSDEGRMVLTFFTHNCAILGGILRIFSLQTQKVRVDTFYSFFED